MNIGIFGESFLPIQDGVGRVMKAYADTLSKRGHHVYVIAPYYDFGYRGDLPFELIDFVSVKLGGNKPYRFGLDQLDMHYRERIKDVKLDIVHVHGPVIAGNAGLHYARKNNIPIVGTFHTKFWDEIFHTTKSRVIADVSCKVIANFFEQLDEVWTVASGTANTLREYGYRGETITMPNGTNKRVLNVSRVPSIREKYGIRTDVPVFLFVGRTIWAKNIKRIIDSCKIMKSRGDQLQLVIVGNGPDFEPIKSYISEVGLESEVVMTGLLQDPEELDCIYSLSTLFLFPSIFDCAPMVLREAACMHLPSIVVRGSDTAEVIVDMENGILADDTNESVITAIDKYLSLSNEEKERIKENAYQTIPLDWDGPLMDRILERYQALIDQYKNN